MSITKGYGITHVGRVGCNFKRCVGYLVILHEKGLQILRQGLPGGAQPALVARHSGQILPTGIDVNLTKRRICKKTPSDGILKWYFRSRFLGINSSLIKLEFLSGFQPSFFLSTQCYLRIDSIYCGFFEFVFKTRIESAIRLTVNSK